MSLIGISSRLDTSERKTFALEDVSVETSKLKSKEKSDRKKWSIISKNCGITTKVVTYV